jgi:hypothetical protein
MHSICSTRTVYNKAVLVRGLLRQNNLTLAVHMYTLGIDLASQGLSRNEEGVAASADLWKRNQEQVRHLSYEKDPRRHVSVCLRLCIVLGNHGEGPSFATVGPRVL